MINFENMNFTNKSFKILFFSLVYIISGVIFSIIFENMIEGVILFWIISLIFVTLILINIHKKIPNEDLNYFFIRIIIALVSYIGYGFLAVKLYNIHDIDMTYWVLGFFGIPISLLLFTKIDILIHKFSKKKVNITIYNAINNLFCMFSFHIMVVLVLFILLFLKEISLI